MAMHEPSPALATDRTLKLFKQGLCGNGGVLSGGNGRLVLRSTYITTLSHSTSFVCLSPEIMNAFDSVAYSVSSANESPF